MTNGEQFKKLVAICAEKTKQFHFYDDEVEAEKVEGFTIN